MSQTQQISGAKKGSLVAGVLVGVVLGGAMLLGVGMWVFSPNPPPASELRLVPGVGGPMTINGRSIVRATPRVVQPAVGVTMTKAGSVTVRAPNAVLQATKRPTQTTWTLSFAYTTNPELIAPAQQPALVARARLANDPFYAKSLGVKPEQVEQLKQVPAVTTLTSPPMTVSDASRAQIIPLLDAYAASQTPQTTEALTAALTKIATESVEPTRAAIKSHVEKIEAILTADQIGAFKS